MRASLASETLRLTPGVPSSLDIEVTNTSSIIDGLSALVIGLEPAWVQLEQPVVTLFPETSGTIRLRIDVPPSCPAGESAITVRVFSTVDPERVVDHVVWLIVDPVELAELEMRPSLVEAGSHASFQAMLHNTGNTASEFAVVALDPTRALECSVSPPTLLVSPGDTGQVTIVAHGKRPLVGSSVERSIQITATSPTLELQAAARFIQKPRIPRGVITALVLILIIALWAVIFLFAIRYLRAGADPTKTVSKTWPTGARQVNLADVAATVSGTVTAASTGEPLPRITVEAFRSDRNGEPILVGSAATGDNGNYTIAALLPGSYRFRFSSAGFAPMWFPAAELQADAVVTPLTPAQTLPGVSMKIQGMSGSISGRVAAPQVGGGGGDATVSVQLIPAPGQDPQPPVTLTTGDAFTIPDLVAPSQYEVRIERPGFDAQVTQVEVGGGQPVVLDTASLTAANGSISGRTVDGAGRPLGGVTVVVRSGTIERTVTTPTIGSVGEFTLDGLETPRTYVLTFTLDGYTSATLALELAGGQSRSGLTAELVGGAGTVSGIVRSSTGQLIGGVAVVVQGRGLQLDTSTLTTGGGANGTGSYSVAGLIAPGTYAITFSKTGFQTTTIGVSLTAAGPISGLDAVMAPSTSTVSGVITVGGVTRAGLNVVLADGTTSRSVVTAASPGGAYSFSNVEPGSYTLTISGAAVSTRIVLIDVARGVDFPKNVDLVAI
ncbi:MAG TPA: carboxypeptidase-like regulatory domain-containing protein [Ilumatobacteraceae bacterium]|nr:carboxypeptidase-like regulatory domain-containing protein [Ilumatobacteraceae bacterium]HRB02037.1 carboxypeptidase-like regulatory domain-containing protein [Ilumatobacteraceae bacterium]